MLSELCECVGPLFLLDGEVEAHEEDAHARCHETNKPLDKDLQVPENDQNAEHPPELLDLAVRVATLRALLFEEFDSGVNDNGRVSAAVHADAPKAADS